MCDEDRAYHAELRTIVRRGDPGLLRAKLPSDKRMAEAIVCSSDPEGTTLLYDACEAKQWDMAAALVREHGHPVDLIFPRLGGSNTLLQMCCKGDTEAVFFLVGHLGANPRATTKHGCTALHLACRLGRNRMARALVYDLKLDVNAFNGKGYTALHEMCVRGSIEGAMFLVCTLGADLYAVTKRGRNVLHCASAGGHTKLLRVLVLEHQLDANTADNEGETPLHSASLHGHRGTALSLINEMGACVRAATKRGLTVLHYACEGGHTKLAHMLVRDFHLNADKADNEGVTPLHTASLQGHGGTALSLIDDLGAHVRAVTKRGLTVLHYACSGGHTKLASILVGKFQLSANAFTDLGETPLHKAGMGGHTGTALSLINDLGAGVDASAADKEGFTPLMSVVPRGHTSTALALINICGARIDAADHFGYSPLHYACYYPRDCLMASGLLAEGARMDVKDRKGLTPQQCIGLDPETDPAAQSVVEAAFVRHLWLQQLGGDVLRLAAAWDHDSLKRAMDALMAAAAKPWACSVAAGAQAAEKENWTAPRHALDMFREAGTGRTALAVAAATGIFRNAELLIQAAASPLELDCDGRTPAQLALAGGSDLMGVWFEAMPVVYWAGHSKLRYRPAATAFLLCSRFSRMRAPAVPPRDEAFPIPGVSYMHPDDWCIPRRDAYRILHFVGPELWGSVWPGPPRGWVGELPGRSSRPVRRVPPRRPAGAPAPAPAPAPAAAPAAGGAAGCAQCGTTVGSLKRCTRCRAASYCSVSCQHLHYKAHKAACRAAGALDLSTVST